MIVVTILLILMSLGAANYRGSVLLAKEAVLAQDLMTLRKAIDQYTLDKQQAPASLDELVSAGYLREIPVDPFTRRKDWVPEFEDVLLTPEQTSVGITNVHSAAEQTSSRGSSYSSW